MALSVGHQEQSYLLKGHKSHLSGSWLQIFSVFEVWLHLPLHGDAFSVVEYIHWNKCLAINIFESNKFIERSQAWQVFSNLS